MFSCSLLQVGGIYQISKASLKPRNAKFNNTPHEYEIYLERSSTVQPCEEDHETRAIPMMMFHVSEQLKHLTALGSQSSADPWACWVCGLLGHASVNHALSAAEAAGPQPVSLCLTIEVFSSLRTRAI